MKNEIEIRELKDEKTIEDFFKAHWTGDFIYSFNNKYYAKDVLAFGAFEGEDLVGMISYVFDGKSCKIVSFNALKKWQGIGTALLEKVKVETRKHGCDKIVLETTNDNIDGLRFYQKRGFVLGAFFPDCITEARKVKPSIPEIGEYGIPLRDAIELEYLLKK